MAALRILLVLGCLGPSLAMADDPVEAARQHYRNGSSAYDLGQYDDAIREYMAAYKLKNDPAILYNLGQANRLANHPSEALHFYKMYLIKVPNAPNRAEVETKIEALHKLIDQQARTQTLPPDQPMREGQKTSPEGSAPEPAATSSAPAPAPATAPTLATAAAPPPEKPVYKRGWFWGVIVGVVAVGVGVGVGVGLGTQAHAPTASEGTVRF